MRVHIQDQVKGNFLSILRCWTTVSDLGERGESVTIHSTCREGGWLSASPSTRIALSPPPQASSVLLY